MKASLAGALLPGICGGSGTNKRGIVITGGKTFYGPITLTNLTAVAVNGATATASQSSLILQGDGSAARQGDQGRAQFVGRLAVQIAQDDDGDGVGDAVLGALDDRLGKVLKSDRGRIFCELFCLVCH